MDIAREMYRQATNETIKRLKQEMTAIRKKGIKTTKREDGLVSSPVAAKAATVKITAWLHGTCFVNTKVAPFKDSLV